MSHKNETAPIGAAAPKAHPSFLSDDVALAREKRKASPPVDVQSAIAEECRAIEAMLLAKNKAYGNSALDPVRIFSKADPVEQIKVRIDDKLSRLARGSDAGEDVEQDLIGYLVLLRVARRLQ